MAAELCRVTLLVVLATSANSQFFDFFQGFQPIATNQQPFGSTFNVRRTESKYKQTTKREETTKAYENDRYNNPLPQYSLDRDQNDYRKKKNTSSISNSYSTTAKPKKKNTTRRLINDKRNQSQDYNNNNKEYDGKINAIVDYYTQKPNYGNNNYGYYTENPFNSNNGVKPVVTNGPPITNRPATRRPIYGDTNKPNYGDNNKPNYGDNNKPNYGDNNKPNYGDNNKQNYGENNKPNYGDNKPNYGDNSKPNYGVNSRPKDEGSIAFPEDDGTPEIIIGPDEDYMTEVEKRRYIELAERKCEEYKALGTKAVQAIPLVPSPEPVQINVGKCAPTTVPLVVGGKVVGIQEFPHMALLGWRKIQAAGYSWKCGGSLVSEQFILTAAHCAFQERDNTVVTGPPSAVQLGSSYLDDPGALVVKVAAVIKHPKYKLPRSYYDLALVKLVNAVKFSEVIKPACLGTAPAVGKSIIATGWGRTEYGGDQSHELRSVSLPIWEMPRCQEVLGTSRKLPQGPSSDSQICAGEERGGKDTCQGDSGGPAQLQEGCIWRVVGVTSLGRSCGAAETPGLYAKVQRAFVASQIFGSQNIRNTSNNENYGNNNANYGNNNANSGNNNGNYGNDNGNSGSNNGNYGNKYDNSNSWINNANYGGNNRRDSVYTEGPNNNNYNNRRPQDNSQDNNTQKPYNNVNYDSDGGYGVNKREQENSSKDKPYNQQDFYNYNSQGTYNRPARYTTTSTTQKPYRGDSFAFDYNNGGYNNQQSNQNYYTTTQKAVNNNNDYANNNYNSQNYGSNSRDQYDYNRNNNYGHNNQPAQRTQNSYSDNRQSNVENYTVDRPWWLT